MTLTRLLILLGACAVFSATGCSDDPPASAKIVSFLASPEEIGASQSARLFWQITNAARIEITETGGAPLDLQGQPSSAGSIEIAPHADTTYELHAFNESGKRVAATTSVDVIHHAPVIDSFTVAPHEAALDSVVQVAWSVRGATAIRITDALDRPIDLHGAAPEAGEVELTARESTTLKLTATGPGGETQADADLRVLGAPTVVIAAPADPVLPGAAAQLSWSAEDATTVRILDLGAGIVLFEGPGRADGSTEVKPQFTSRYAIEATGIGGSASANATVQVTPVIDSFVVASSSLHVGEEAELRWTVRGARSLSIMPDGGAELELEATQIPTGSIRLPVPVGGSFRLIAATGDLRAETDLAVSLDATPFIRAFDSNPPAVSVDETNPAQIELSWVVDDAERIEIEWLSNGLMDLAGASPDAGFVAATLTETSTFLLTASNEHGSSTRELTVGDFQPPSIASFSALPAWVESGEAVHFSWTTEFADHVSIEKDGLPLAVPPRLVNGSFSDATLTDATYVLRAFNQAGVEIASEPIAIAIGAPEILAFEADWPTAWEGAPLTFSWRNLGGQNLSITDEADNTVCSTVDLERIPAGDCTITAPSKGAHAYTLHLISGIGTEVKAEIAIISTDGPIVRTFEATPALLTLGEATTLTWAVENDLAGNTPVLALTDDSGNTYTLTGAVNGGTEPIVPLSAGNQTLTLTASTDGTATSTLTAAIDVRDVPTIVTFDGTPSLIDTQGGTIPPAATLAWTTTNGVSLSIFVLDEAGERVIPAIHTTTVAADVAAGTLPVVPVPGPNDYEVEIDNGAGRLAIGNVTIEVDPAEVLTFTASPNDLLAGESTTLSWTTNRATGATISPPLALTQTNTFVDISTSPTVRNVTVTTSQDEGVATITFPTTFTFPYAGVDRTMVKAGHNGWLSFQGTPPASTASGTQLPRTHTAYAYMQLAPFWTDLHALPTGAAQAQLLWNDGTDAEGAYVVIQWKNFHFQNQPYSDLNFQVVLRANGNFEYRYGTMSHSTPAMANGSTASIGWQHPGGLTGMNLSFNTAVSGGLANKGWAITSSVPANQPGVTVVPAASTYYTLTALNDHSSDSLSQAVSVTPAVKFASATITAGDLIVGSNITIGWSVGNATAVTIVDDLGATLYTPTPAEFGFGTHTFQAATAGQRVYTVRAVGGLPRDEQTRAVTANVYAAPFTIDSFTSSQSVVAPNDPVTLGWATTGAGTGATLTLTGHMAATIGTTGKSVAADSVVVNPAVTSRYVLTVQEAAQGTLPGRVRTAQKTVSASTTRMNTPTASPTQIAAGGSTTVSWTSSNADHAIVMGQANATVTDVSATAPFVTISGTSGAVRATQNQSGSSSDHDFTVDFATLGASATTSSFVFPFEGENRTVAKAVADGGLSFDLTTVSNASNSALPAASFSSAFKWAMFPFWDNLQHNDTAEVWYKLVTPASGPRHLVVEWKGYQLFNQPTSNLNFQVVLFEDGTWEYRYGTMSYPTDGNLANGSSATIGWQIPSSTAGQTWSYNTAVSGGLSGKSLRFDRRLSANGSAQVTPTETGNVRVCAGSTGFTECKDVLVTVVQTGDVLVTEIMAATSTPDAEWFEVRNVAPYAIDLAGFTLDSGPTESVTIPASPSIPLQPGQAALLARTTGTTGAASSSHVYGTGLTLDELASDEITLKLGTLQIDRVLWDATWFPNSGVSRSLDPVFQNRVQADNDAVANWCTSTTAFAGTSLGSPLAQGSGCKVGAAYDVVPHAGYGFIDIASTGDDIAVANASCGYQSSTTGGTALGFTVPMPWFATTVSTLYASSEGYVSFNPLTNCNSGNHTTMPSASQPNAIVAAFWDDLLSQPGSSVKTELKTVGGSQVRIVQWTNFMRFGNPGSITFQLQIWETGDIVTAYQNMSWSSAADGRKFYEGSDAMVGGLEDATGANGRFFTGNKRVVYPGLSILLDRR